jgi:hypothetical protein
MAPRTGGDRARVYAAVAIAAALGVAAVYALRPTPAPKTLVQSTRSVRIVWHDRLGLAERQRGVRAPERVRALVAALGVEGHPKVECPADYSDAEVSIILFGEDTYARKTVHLWGVVGMPTVLSVDAFGCRRGPPADVDALRRELARHDDE